MTDAIQIPQRAVPSAQFAAPEGVIRDYLNWKAEQPFKLSDQVQQSLNTLVDTQFRKQQLGIERTRAASDILKDYAAAKVNFGDDADSLYQPLLQSMGMTSPNQTIAASLPSTTTVPPNRTTAQNGGTLPSNAPNAPQASAQTLTGGAPGQQTSSPTSSVIADTMKNDPTHAQTLGIQNHEIQDYIADPIGFMKRRGKIAADRAQQGLAALRSQQELNANQPFTAEQSQVVYDTNSTPADLARAFPNGIPQAAQQAFNSTRNYGGESARFAQTKQQELNSKQEQIEKEYQEKNLAIQNAIDAVNTSLSLKQKAASGPISGGLASMAGDITHGAVASPTYLLNQHNALAAPLLQHSQDVNRFNPVEVSTLKGGGLSLPGEPLDVSEKKANQVLDVYQRRLAQNEREKAAKLSALGISYQPQLPAGSNGPAIPSAPAGTPTGFVRIEASDGSLHDIPKQNLQKARQRDPGLKVVSQNGN